MLDVFVEAATLGLVDGNPVEITRTAKATVTRDRLSIDQFFAIREYAAPWLVNAMNVALITGQRREDVAKAQFKDLREGFLWIEQGKMGAKVRIESSIRLNALGMSIDDLVRVCRSDGVVSKYLVHHSRSKFGNTAGAKVSISMISNSFAAARELSGIAPAAGKTPPTFHEIRSLAERLYREQYGADFAQKLLGHKTQKMTDIYDDLRGSAWVDVRAV